MADPFQNVDAAGEDFIAAFADSMDARQDDPTMEAIVADYLGRAHFAADGLTVEVGCGAGAITRRIADHANPAKVVGLDPSNGFIREAARRAGDRANLSFAVADGADLPFDDQSADNVVLHTVLTHVTAPDTILTEATRILKPGGTMMICDADFSKASLGSFEDDPLQVCARYFVREFVTDPHLVSKLRDLISACGLTLSHFDLRSRPVLDNEQMLPWVAETARLMLERGEIGETLHQGLIEEYHRRMQRGTLYGYQVFATAVAKKS
ncbi:class I SAM-dependent methyltransferase [Pontivivens insulae]|uniref:Demethylrebeccamycin-D-glucose O-methyltransferase n=1 Tax=Pontivivens insulae TaxID=1639689 RepID=A0A2R8AD06_9RHOB|nr:class I SAM-dependent methyltransferase [Pontivivens insulae]RED13844.1 methyltransferase family protein [Pontivivens insulae]SPF29918.1 Demethylrebeccamycin-D-glucose O-methyltransferase [Pontivivens insulae]